MPYSIFCADNVRDIQYIVPVKPADQEKFLSLLKAFSDAFLNADHADVMYEKGEISQAGFERLDLQLVAADRNLRPLRELGIIQDDKEEGVPTIKAKVYPLYDTVHNVDCRFLCLPGNKVLEGIQLYAQRSVRISVRADSLVSDLK